MEHLSWNLIFYQSLFENEFGLFAGIDVYQNHSPTSLYNLTETAYNNTLLTIKCVLKFIFIFVCECVCLC